MELTLVGAIIATIQWIKIVDTQNRLSGYVTLPVALLMGALAGYLNLFGTATIEAGLASGFVAVATATVASKVAGTK